jgi:hypothetical protein
MFKVTLFLKNGLSETVRSEVQPTMSVFLVLMKELPKEEALM